jgi:hypothetical protein
MEDASAVDLDWFWRGWYFGTDPVDISIDSVKWFRMDDKRNAAAFSQPEFEAIHKQRNKADKSMTYYVDTDTTLRDFYWQYPGADAKMYADMQAKMSEAQKDVQNASKWADKHLYELTFSNKGGMVMPVIVEWTFKDGSKQVDRLPVTIWRSNERQFSKVFVKDKEVVSLRLDPMKETADINESNGMWPVREMPSRFQLYKGGQAMSRGAGGGGNAMQRANAGQ